jgi:hypothetical protein
VHERRVFALQGSHSVSGCHLQEQEQDRKQKGTRKEHANCPCSGFMFKSEWYRERVQEVWSDSARCLDRCKLGP